MNKFKFTKEHLTALIPGNTKVDAWYAALCDVLPKYGIDTPRRVAHFISQCAHESNNFRSLEENLNYSADALIRVFPRYFGTGKKNALEYARNPEKIANYVYMDEFRTSKMGNVKPGDGWRFRGRGLKQLTGRDNYTRFGKSVGMTAEQAADYVATEKGAIESAAWFWDTNKLNTIADTDDVALMTKRINGGNIGLEDRQRRYNHAISLLEVKTSSPAAKPTNSVNMNETLRVGSKGETVKAVQTKLGLKADGNFGPETERTVKEWQAQNGLTVDGIVGIKTLKRLLE
jgi:putative chitinase